MRSIEPLYCLRCKNIMLPPIRKFAPPRYTTNGETMCFLKHMQQASRYT